ncbi:MAG TPA: sugar MFS transporter [Bacteroidales bacterium]|jgi:FHS family L-fucose permease-like MFS transporter|nr:MFS transporter [Bacteroidales bacterium]NLK54622.1 sugar MFS transporter [Bacteroidales bacterium]HNY51826.1 sugar MFS transporter [Bacteroidales bacterium]HOG55965.1 sugar MFS transporter [Bacteroidales bacterium]HPB12457.1 sugar MFS transporter [Bacteroidales bacterium]
MATSNSSNDISKKDYVFAITIIGLFFFIFGFVTWLNGVLIPFLRTACELTDFQAYFVTAAFYISYFVMALPSSLILKKTGFKMGMSVGLWVMAVGAVVFIPAAISRTYGLFLTGLFVQGTGLALLQTAVNPYVTIIGPRESAAKRISIMGIANKFAGVVAPIILASVLLKDSNVIEEKLATSLDAGARAVLLDEMARGVIVPYIIMAIVLVLLGLLIMFVHLPDVDTDAEDEEVGVANVKKTSIWQFPHLLLGVLALFFYVGVEVIAGDSIIRYGQSLGVSMDSAKYFTSLTMTFMILGYVLGIALIPKYLKQGDALKICAILGVIFSIGALIAPADKVFTMPFIDLMTFEPLHLVLPVTVLFVALLGFANSLVWPAMWPLALNSLGKFTKTGSAMLIMAIAGGAIIPLLYGKLADLSSTQAAYWICIPCYLVIMFYAFYGYKIGLKNEA